MGRTSSPGRRHFLLGMLALGVLSWSVNPALAAVRRPPNYHHDHMPETSFTCAGKVVGGYYADPDADCQMFHVCVQVDENDVRDFKFMCPNDTVFDQENFICANWFEIDCRSSTFFYDKNLQLFQPNVEQDKNKTTGTSSASGSATGQPSEQQKRQQEQQLKQLMVLEEQQAAQVFKQQQVIDQHERRQQEHQRNQLQIIQDQQKQQEKQQGRKTTAITTATPAVVAPRSIGSDKTTTPSSGHYAEEKGEESVIEYDYYYYDYDDSLEHGNFYANDDYDPEAPGRIIDPTNARPALLPIIPPSTSVVKAPTQLDHETKHKL